MNFEEIIETYENGNIKDAVYEIKHNFGWNEFATEIRDYELLSVENKLSILTRLLIVGY